jgi:flagellar biosynthesis regulator FlbT
LDEMFKYYEEEVFEELKEVHKQIVAKKIMEELMSFKTESIYEDHLRKANEILNKYEILTREYQSQNKNLKENHDRIIAEE